MGLRQKKLNGRLPGLAPGIAIRRRKYHYDDGIGTVLIYVGGWTKSRLDVWDLEHVWACPFDAIYIEVAVVMKVHRCEICVESVQI